MRAIHTTTINFGMVTIPVKVYSTVSSDSLDIHLIHKECNSRLTRHFKCVECDVLVDQQDQGRVYEYSKGVNIPLTESELSVLEPDSSKTIDIKYFISEEDIDPLYGDKTYLLGTDATGIKGYNLLHDALLRLKKYAFGRYCLRKKVNNVIIKPYKEALLLQTLHSIDLLHTEIEEILPKGNQKDLSKQEKELANQIVRKLSKKFSTDEMVDLQKGALRELIASKINQQPPLQGKVPPPRPATDLMDKLKETLELASK